MSTRASPLDLMALMAEADRMNQRWLQFINNSRSHWENEHCADTARAGRADMFYLTNEEVLLMGWDYVSWSREQSERGRIHDQQYTNKEKSK